MRGQRDEQSCQLGLILKGKMKSSKPIATWYLIQAPKEEEL